MNEHQPLNTNLKIISRRKAIETLATSALVTLLVPPIYRITSTLETLAALRGVSINCLDGKEAQDPAYLVDAIVIPGAGMIKKDGVYEPNSHGKIRLEAAAIAYLRNWAPKIVLLDGETSQDARLVSENYLQETFRQLTRNARVIPTEAILKEHESINTASDMQELAKIAPKYNFKTTVTISTGPHAQRAALFSCNLGIPTFAVQAEELFKDQERLDDPNNEDSRREETLTRIRDLPNDVKEAIKIIATIWDPEGEIPTHWKKLNLPTL